VLKAFPTKFYSLKKSKLGYFEGRKSYSKDFFPGSLGDCLDHIFYNIKFGTLEQRVTLIRIGTKPEVQKTIIGWLQIL